MPNSQNSIITGEQLPDGEVVMRMQSALSGKVDQMAQLCISSAFGPQAPEGLLPLVVEKLVEQPG